MQTEVKFSSKRFLLALLLCACSVILLQNNNLSTNASFTFNAVCIAAGLAVCFLFFLPSLILKKKTDSDVPTLARRYTPRLRIPLTVFYALYFVYAALYFLLPYIDMFHTKYFPEVTPCLITFLMLLCCAYAACKGVNVISRFGIFLFLFALFTNILMFGGSLSELDFSHYDFELSGDFNALIRNTLYFAVPSFIAVIFACCSGLTRNFRFRQPVFTLIFTGVKYAAVLFFIRFALGDYAGRQTYPAFVLSRVAHFGSFAGIESFYLALATMSVFMIVSLFLCCISRGTRGDGDRKTTLIFTLIIFALYVAATYINSVKEILINPILLLLLTFIAAVMLPTAYIFAGRKSNAKGN